MKINDCDISSEKIIRASYEKLTKLLIQKNLSITTMESASSGQIASLITDTEGSSAIFKGSFVSYSNEAKILMGVNRNIIEEYGVYSKQTALAMAKAAKNYFKADIAVGVTGTIGKIDLNNQKSSIPGKVFFAIDYKDEKALAFEYDLLLNKDRLGYKLAVAELVYKAIMTFLK